MKQIFLSVVLLATAFCSCVAKEHISEGDHPIVYVTRDISPESLIRIYKALGRKAEGRVAVKISTGEKGNPNHLQPALIGDLVKMVNGKLVECNTAYAGKRGTFEEHKAVVEEHGFNTIGGVDLMDEEGEFRIPCRDQTHLRYDIVGTHLRNYDFMINLAHFKGHPMGGLGGVLKNQSIGVASANGKAYIHTAGYQAVLDGMWQHCNDQDGFLESMAAAAQAVSDYFGQGERILYISVLNNMTVDCDCVAKPAPVMVKDYGIMASLDPVALDQACVDVVFGMEKTADSDPTHLQQRIESRHGTHTIEWAEKIGMGSRKYKLVSIDK
ncbi:MAG: DUF362 domain-containing protein [Bacteroidales bacterium]|nr:DUF362 domain-containing protein [Candidatus Physcousia equi]